MRATETIVSTDEAKPLNKWQLALLIGLVASPAICIGLAATSEAWLKIFN